MSTEFYRGSPGKFDSRTLNRKTLSRWTERISQKVVGVNMVLAEYNQIQIWLL